jgi:hypothetical protein
VPGPGGCGPGLLGGGALGVDGRGLLGGDGDDGDGLEDDGLEDDGLEDEPDDAVVLLRVGSATVVPPSSRSRKNSSAPTPAITSTPTTARTTASRPPRCAGRPWPPGGP